MSVKKAVVLRLLFKSEDKVLYIDAFGFFAYAVILYRLYYLLRYQRCNHHEIITCLGF